MKSLKFRSCIALILTALMMAGLSAGALAHSNSGNNTEQSDGIGGGYAVTGQIDNVGCQKYPDV